MLDLRSLQAERQIFFLRFQRFPREMIIISLAEITENTEIMENVIVRLCRKATGRRTKFGNRWGQRSPEQWSNFSVNFSDFRVRWFLGLAEIWTPYFARKNHSQCLILQKLQCSNALFCKKRNAPMPYFTKKRNASTPYFTNLSEDVCVITEIISAISAFSVGHYLSIINKA